MKVAMVLRNHSSAHIVSMHLMGKAIGNVMKEFTWERGHSAAHIVTRHFIGHKQTHTGEK